MSTAPTDLSQAPLGVVTRCAKTVAESDVYLYAGITGDLYVNHVNEEVMRATPYGGRIAHGLLVLGYTSPAASEMAQRLGGHAVSYGYDRVRFTAAVRFGDTITTTYRLARVDEERGMAFADVEVHNQRDELCMVATHVLKFV